MGPLVERPIPEISCDSHADWVGGDFSKNPDVSTVSWDWKPLGVSRSGVHIHLHFTSVDVSCTVQRVTRVVPSRYESVCHPDPTVSSSTPSAEKGITCQTACKNHSLRTKTQKCLRKTTQRDADSDLITGNCSILERNERICAETAKVRLQ